MIEDEGFKGRLVKVFITVGVCGLIFPFMPSWLSIVLGLSSFAVAFFIRTGRFK